MVDVLYRFHVIAHARPPGVNKGDSVVLNGHHFETLAVRPDKLATPMRVSFEAAVAAMSEMPRMHVEADGSFVWVSASHGPQWQIDGNLYDRDERLLLVDLKGRCLKGHWPAPHFDQLLQAWGHDDTPLMFQLAREAVFVDEAEFRRWAEITAAQS